MTDRRCLGSFMPALSVLAAILIAFLSPAVGAQDAGPAEARGFAGGGLNLYPLGWSSEGRWGALIGGRDSNSEIGITLLIIDAVTDEVLFRSKPMEWAGPEAFDEFWVRYGRSVSDKAASFDLESSMKADVRDARFTTGGVSYEFIMTPPSPAAGRYTLRISSSRGDGKDVYGSPAVNPPHRSVLLGAMVSPFEARALAIVRESPAYGNGEPIYRFIGAHLTQGFTSRYTAVRPSSSTGSLVSTIYNGQEYLLRSRLAAGADPNSRDERGYSCILIASRLGHWNMVVDLLAAGASPGGRDDAGRTALHYAAFAGNAKAVNALLAAGANKSSRDAAGLVPGDLAADQALRTLLR